MVRHSELDLPRRLVLVCKACSMFSMNRRLDFISAITISLLQHLNHYGISVIRFWSLSMMRIRLDRPIIFLILVRVRVSMVGRWLPRERQRRLLKILIVLQVDSYQVPTVYQYPKNVGQLKKTKNLLFGAQRKITSKILTSHSHLVL